MGNHCSAVIAKPLEGLHTCGRFGADGSLEDGDACGLCEDDVPHGTLNGPPGLLSLHSLQQEDGTPATPRGPAPPWVIASNAPKAIDRTATGATPPRSPTPPRYSPPGLPEDGPKEAVTVLSLHSTFDSGFVRELFRAARAGNSTEIARLLNQVHNGALSLVSSTTAAGGREAAQSRSSAEKSEKAAELVASFLSKARDTSAACGVSGETLLGAAALAGHLDVLQLLLNARADPCAADSQGCTALHRAAESGRVLCVLLALDRMQATVRNLNVAELTSSSGENPEMLAALNGSSDICRAFELFSEMQNDAELRQLGSGLPTSDMSSGGQRGSTGDFLSLIDLAAEARAPSGVLASALLRRHAGGGGLLRNIFARVPEDERELKCLITEACDGIRRAEEHLLKNTWTASDPSLEAPLRTLVATCEVRSAWQHFRQEAVQNDPANGLDDFWQTHLSAETMVATMSSARGETFQLLLTVLWLYTREAWLRHIVDALATALHAMAMPSKNGGSHGADGATGATPLRDADDLASWTASWSVSPTSARLITPLVNALAPIMQLVQAALGWFEESGIRHSGPTYRPLSVPMLGLQRLIDRYVAFRREAGEDEDGGQGGEGEAWKLTSGAWVALGAGAFFSAMSSRSEALRRVSRTRCNVLLVIKPADKGPCFPKQMSLRGSAVDDVLFQLGALFQITRVRRTVSSDLDPEGCGQNANSRWPVMIIELQAANRFLEAMEVLEGRGDLSEGLLELQLQQWCEGAPKADEAERLLDAGDLLQRCARGEETKGARDRLQQASLVLQKALSLARAADNASVAARALLGLARCKLLANDSASLAADGKMALHMLEKSLGASHPETCAARLAWRELGVHILATD
eukprot:TRINITY_DN101532_c0_g1_i1.p1 TRINITY_DN101532_c0_g1~~TRINITY_DN101532_c0_g1_i1.p1  ORF type:complete len:870 (+),score=213.26 TRINITY_DN101532_c0_g1_i1:85-2694(+)